MIDVRWQMYGLDDYARIILHSSDGGGNVLSCQLWDVKVWVKVQVSQRIRDSRKIGMDETAPEMSVTERSEACVFIFTRNKCYSGLLKRIKGLLTQIHRKPGQRCDYFVKKL